MNINQACSFKHNTNTEAILRTTSESSMETETKRIE